MEAVSVTKYLDPLKCNQYPLPNPEECRLLTFQLANRPDVVDKVHNVCPQLDGCFMEALLAFAFGCRLALDDDDSILKYFKVATILVRNIRDKLCSSVWNTYKINPALVEIGIEKQVNEFFQSTLNGDLLGLYDDGNQPIEFILFYCLAYVVKDNKDKDKDKDDPKITIDNYVQYLNALLANFTEIYKYITDIKDKFHRLFRNIGVPKYHVKCRVEVDNYVVSGECDFAFNSLLVDVKAWATNSDSKYLRQLELYNHTLKKQSIAILNVFRNELILYSKFDHLERYLEMR